MRLSDFCAVDIVEPGKPPLQLHNFSVLARKDVGNFRCYVSKATESDMQSKVFLPGAPAGSTWKIPSRCPTISGVSFFLLPSPFFESSTFSSLALERGLAPFSGGSGLGEEETEFGEESPETGG
jgi:hypothetical protein